MTSRLLAASSPGEVRIALVGPSGLEEYAIWRPGRPDGVGDLHRARVIARVPSMGGAFLTLEGEDGFLPDSETPDGLGSKGAGAMLGVRVTRAAQGGKGKRLTARLDPGEKALAEAASGPPRLLRRGPGPLLDLAAAHPEAAVLTDDPALLAELRPALGDRLGLARPVFDPDLAAALEALGEAETVLPGGARFSIHPTPALVAIDVDAGAMTAAARGKAAAQQALNAGLLPALARAIRLRNLSGAILIDLAGMRPRQRAALGPALAALLAADPLQPRLLGFTALGLAEIVRKRVRPPLHELLSGPHAAGLAGLRQAAAEAAAAPGRALALRAAPPIITAIRDDPVALPDLLRRTGRRLELRADPALAGCVLEAACPSLETPR